MAVKGMWYSLARVEKKESMPLQFCEKGEYAKGLNLETLVAVSIIS
jgi:hypothetical protein